MVPAAFLPFLPGDSNQNIPGTQTPSGPIRFRAIPTGSAVNALSNNRDIPAPMRAAMDGATVIAMETTDKECPEGTKNAGKRHVNFHVLTIDESDSDNAFIVDQSKKTATLTLRGTMQKFIPGPNYCEEATWVKGGSGPGSFDVTFQTRNHTTPRNFIAMTASGSINGPEISDTVGRLPGAVGPVGTSFSLDEISASTGFNIPNLPTGQGAGQNSINPNAPFFTANLAGSQIIPVTGNPPRIIIIFSAGSAKETLGLSVYKPDVMGGQMVPDGVEMTRGVQLFVNNDNDDQDEFFDYEIADRPVPGENDLVKVVMSISPQRASGGGFGTAQLDISEGAQNIRIWEDKEMTSRFNHRRPMEIPGEFEPDGLMMKRTVWVEGSVAHNSQRGSALKFTYSESPKETDEASFTVIGLEKIEWEGVDNSENDDDILTEDPNHGVPTAEFNTNPNNPTPWFRPLDPKGVRVFPGSRYVNGKPEARIRNRVRAVATLSVDPVEPLTMYFRSFDVDDPTASDKQHKEVDDESAEEDNRGETIAKFGKIARSDDNGIAPLEFSSKTANMSFQVTMQPGDNFRIVGGIDRNYLMDLHNDDNLLNVGTVSNFHKQRIVNRYIFDSRKDPEKSEVRDHKKWISPTLTVWRRVYVEYDKMMPVEGNFLKGRIKRISPGFEAGYTNIHLDLNIQKTVKAATTNGLMNSYKGGEIDITGVGKFEIFSSTAQDDGSDDTVVVKGSVPEDARNNEYVIKDDDYIDHGFDEGDEIPDLDFTNLDRYNQLNYVMFDLTTLEATNTRKNPPFVPSTLSDEGEYLVKNYRFDHIDEEANENAWTVYVLAAFQGTHAEDGDPDGENCLCGIVDKVNGIGAYIFIEGLNDMSGFLNNGVRLPTHAQGAGERDTIAHEIGHLLGAEHGDTGIMDQQSRNFSAVSIRKMRTVTHP